MNPDKRILDPNQPSFSEKNDFQKFHDEMRDLNRRSFVRIEKGTVVRDKIADRPKGKLAQKAAKRERVRQRKEAQNA